MYKNRQYIVHSFVVCAVVICIFLLPILFMYLEIKNILVSQLKTKALSIGETISVMINEDIESYRKLYEVEDYSTDSFDRDYYEHMLESFRIIKNKTDASYIFTEKVLSREDIMFILDAQDPSSDDFSNIGDLESANDISYNAYIKKESVVTDIVYTEGWGSYLTAFVPIIDRSSGEALGLIGVDFSAEKVVLLLRAFKIISILVVLLLSTFFIYVYFYFVKYVYRRANIDPLTGIQNRRSLDEKLKQMIRNKEDFIAAFVDIDNFKSINDNYGHLKGDLILKRVANLISINIKKDDQVYRYGGDEFFVIFYSDNLAGIEAACSRLLRQTEIIDMENKNEDNPFVSLSIGIARYKQGMKAEEIIHLADLAMQYSKETGKNRLRVYEEELGL